MKKSTVQTIAAVMLAVTAVGGLAASWLVALAHVSHEVQDAAVLTVVWCAALTFILGAVGDLMDGES